MTEAPRKGISLLAIFVIFIGLYAYVEMSHNPVFREPAPKRWFLLVCTLVVIAPAAIRRITRKGRADLRHDLFIPLAEVLIACGILIFLLRF